jgi:hypothetical protein
MKEKRTKSKTKETICVINATNCSKYKWKVI